VTTVAAELEPGASVAGARRHLAAEFRRRGLETPELDARLLVAQALALDHSGLAANAHRRLSVKDTGAIAALAARRLAREPVARILGRREFWGLPLRLNADTLVPRPETETVVEAALASFSVRAPDTSSARAALASEASGQRGDSKVRVADLGTGSGALMLALMSELPEAFGIATDVSTAALACARDNAAALGLTARVAFVACDYGAALDGRFDLVVSNPPYVARYEIAALAPEVRDFDPRRALDGGIDGLDGYRAIAADARRLLAPGGTLVLELGAGMATAVTALLGAAGLGLAAPPRHDLAGVARALVARPLP
jgi:release factor glutamine methyltransferase